MEQLTFNQLYHLGPKKERSLAEVNTASDNIKPVQHCSSKISSGTERVHKLDCRQAQANSPCQSTLQGLEPNTSRSLTAFNTVSQAQGNSYCQWPTSEGVEPNKQRSLTEVNTASQAEGNSYCWWSILEGG